MEKNEKRMEQLEIIIAIFLGITAVLTAWASWQSSLYDGNQASMYTASTNQMSDANTMYSKGTQTYLQDTVLWGEMANLYIDIEFAGANNNTQEQERLKWKLAQLEQTRVSFELQEAVDWYFENVDNPDITSPFDYEDLMNGYYSDAETQEQEALASLASGEKANELGDQLGLVTVVYSVVLFLLGISAAFKTLRTRYVLCGASAIGFTFATILMVGVPIITL